MMCPVRYLWLFVLTINSCFAQNEDTLQIRRVFEMYKTAVLNNAGEEATKLLANETVELYDSLAGKVKFADSISVEYLTSANKFMVLLIRNLYDRDSILQLDGKKLLIFSFKNGLVGKNGIADSFLGRITLNSDFAKAEIIKNTKQSNVQIHFYKENNAWKVNITHLMSSADSYIKLLIKQSEKTENEFLLLLVENLSGKKAGNQIWAPVKKL